MHLDSIQMVFVLASMHYIQKKYYLIDFVTYLLYYFCIFIYSYFCIKARQIINRIMMSAKSLEELEDIFLKTPISYGVW
jgi:hypothetical protein